MHSNRILVTAAAAALSVGGLLLVPTSAEGSSSSGTAPPAKVSLHRVGQATVVGGTSGELRPDPESMSGKGKDYKAVRNRSLHSRARDLRGTPPPSGVVPTQPSLGVTTQSSGWRALNHYEQRFTDGGNQFSTEPPDQALCVGNGQVFEGVNTAFRVYDTAGSPMTDVISMNQFYFGDHEYNRATGVLSPHSLGDPSCIYDAGTNRFIVTSYDLSQDSAGTLLGPSYIDIAVSPAGSAIGKWSIYQLDTTNDGTDGTPSRPGCPCFADYPHLGTDANGLYITTNEYSTIPFGETSNGAMVYAIDKTALTGSSSQVSGVVFDTRASDPNQGTTYDGFTLAPAVSNGTSYAPNAMYFLSSDAFSGDTPITSRQILVWKIDNTSALKTNPSSLRLTHTTVPVNAYTVPPYADQKPGSVPLADCLNVTACAKVALGTPDRYKEYEGPLDTNDSRMQQSAYAHGMLWGALDTAVDIGGATKAGVAYYVINPANSGLVKQGTIAVAGNHISYPALGVTPAGKGVMALSLMGRDYYPSAAYVQVNDVAGSPASGVKVVGAGVGPQDGFSEYRGFGLPFRPRWGDYGAASVVGNKVWIASEYIAQSCTLAEFQAAPFGTCGGTRSALGNWATHIAGITP